MTAAKLGRLKFEVKISSYVPLKESCANASSVGRRDSACALNLTMGIRIRMMYYKVIKKSNLLLIVEVKKH